MKLLRGLLSFLPVGRYRRRCRYCRGAKLELSRGSTANVTHLDCPRCGREYEQKAGGRVHSRWRTPLKEALFLASQSTAGLAGLSHIQGVWRVSVIEDVKRELAHPTRRLTELFLYRSPRTEEELREYLAACVTPDTTDLDAAPLEAAAPGTVESLER
jgi:hypothetical protein